MKLKLEDTADEETTTPASKILFDQEKVVRDPRGWTGTNLNEGWEGGAKTMGTKNLEGMNDARYHPAEVGWRGTYKGYTWRDMPGSDYDCKKLNFFLFRRGLYDPKAKAWADSQNSKVRAQMAVLDAKAAAKEGRAA